MHPIICTIGPLTIYSYGLMLVVAFIVGSTLACRQAKKDNLNPDHIFNYLFLVFLSGIIGARLFFVLENIGLYLKNPLEIIMLQRGGLSWFGGLISGVFVSIAYLKKKKLPLYKTLDLVIPFVALAQAIGRIGCLLNGCCFGRVSKFGLYFAVHQARLIPTQIYSSLALIFIFLFLRFLQERPHREGALFFLYLVLYATKRFIIEFWRADHQSIFLGLSLFQIISMIIFFIATTKLILMKR